MNDHAAVNPFRPLGEALLRTPDAAVAGVLSGRLALGAQQRAEPEDVFADLLAHPLWQEQRAALTDRLDGALLAWIEERVSWTLKRIASHGTRAYAAEFSDALAIAARLPLPRTARELVENQPEWDNRLGTLRWPGEIDLLRQLDMVLVSHQADTRFGPRWFASCDRAAWGGPHWRTDLATGLLGLRKLPHPPGHRPEQPVAAALARFAALAPRRGLGEAQVQTAFQRGAAALRVLYPRRDEHWPFVWEEVLKDLAKSQWDAARVIETRWLPTVLPAAESVTREPRGSGRTARTKEPAYAELPSKEELDAVLGELKKTTQLTEGLWLKVRGHMRRHFAFAEFSGDPNFAGLTLHNLGYRLLRLAPDEGQLQELHAWTLRMLEWDPDNAYVWGLWARVLTELGQPETSIAVRWETIRRFPKDAVLRNELAVDLRSTGQAAIAEHLLRQTMRDFPRDEYCRNSLADLWRESGRTDEAEELLRETMHDFPRDPVCRNSLADLWRESGRTNGAEALLRETIQKFPRNIVSRTTLALLLWQQDRLPEAETVLAKAEHLDPADPYVQVLGRWIRGEELPPAEYLAEHRLPMPFYLQVRTQPDDEDAVSPEAQPPEPSEDVSRQAAGRLPADQPGTDAEPAETEQVVRADTRAAPGENAQKTNPPPPVATPIQSAAPFLEQLRSRAALIEGYFTGANGGTESLRDQAETGASDLALVAAHRAGLLVGSEGRDLLDRWVRVRPASYSARLLQAWKGSGDAPADAQALESIDHEFPEQRAWTDWLRLPELSKAKRSALLAEFGRSRNKHDRSLWHGRIEAAYPELSAEADTVAVDSDVLGRLLEDIALAEAAPAVPSVAIS